MKPLEIRKSLLEKGKRASTLAHVVGASPALMTQALNGKGSELLRIKIALTIQKPPSRIWVNASRRQNLIDDDIYYHALLYPEYREKSFIVSHFEQKAGDL